MKYRPEIDGLRAISVLAVLGFHGELPGCERGYLGVDVFFVLSGYLITAVLFRDFEAGRFSLLHFYERRIRRLFAPVFVVAATVLAVGSLVSFPNAWEELGWGAVGVATHTANIVLWVQTDYWAQSAEENPLLHTWSLAVEEQFYLVYPLLLWGVWRWRQDRGLVAIAVGAALLVSLLLDQRVEQIDTRLAFYGTPFRTWELMVGALVSIATASWKTPVQRRDLPAWVALFAVVVTLTPLGAAIPGPIPLVACLGTAVCLATCHADGGPGWWLSRRGPVLLGLISYSLYLWHQPLLAFAQQLAEREPPLRARVLLLAASVGLAWLSWRFIERPTRDPAATSRRTLWAGWIGGTSLLVVLGVVIGRSDGWPSRFSPPVRQALAQITLIEERPTPCDDDVSPCEIGDGRPTWILWGDSHAAVLTPSMPSTPGWRYVQYNCAPFVLEPDTACANHNQQALEAVETQRPEVVVLAMRWSRELGLQRDKRCEPGEVELGTLDPVAVDELLALVDRLVALDVRVVVVGQLPEPRCSPPRVLARQRWWGTPDTLEHLGLAPDVWQEARSALTPLYRDLEHRGAEIVDPFEALCHQGPCAVEADGELLFYDDHHLSDAGARRVLESVRW